MTSLAVSASAEQANSDTEALVRAAARGDETCFRKLYATYARTVYNIALRSMRDAQEAEDVSQEVWMKVHKKMDTLHNPEKFPAWLYRITAQSCIDAVRRRERVRTRTLVDAATSNYGDPESIVADQDEARLTWEALARLPVHQHLALYLKDVEGRPYREIATALGVSETAVGLLLFRGRRSFVRAYRQVAQSGLGERCEGMHPVLSRVIDGEASPVQQRAARAHAEACRGCRGELASLRESKERYAGLALAPLPATLTARVLGTSAASTGIGSFAQTIASLVTALKPGAMALVASGALTATALATSADADSARQVVSPPAAGVASGLGPGAIAAPELWPSSLLDGPGDAQSPATGQLIDPAAVGAGLSLSISVEVPDLPTVLFGAPPDVDALQFVEDIAPTVVVAVGISEGVPEDADPTRSAPIATASDIVEEALPAVPLPTTALP